MPGWAKIIALLLALFISCGVAAADEGAPLPENPPASGAADESSPPPENQPASGAADESSPPPENQPASGAADESVPLPENQPASGATDESSPPPKKQTSSEATTGFLDEYHNYMLDQIKVKTLWFDEFFGDRRAEEEDRISSFVRLRTVARYVEGEGMTFPIRLRANLELPKVNRRLRLIIFGGNDEDDLWQEPGDSIDTSLQRADEKDWTNLGLRYMIYKTLRERLHFGGGLSVRWPLDYYVRVRYERVLHIGSKSIIRLSETGYWNSLNGFGETSRFDLEKPLGSGLYGRLSLYATYSEDVSGLQWGAETNLFRPLSKTSAMSFDMGAYGSNKPSIRVGTYRIASRYRRNFLRPWLFLEIEPEVLFPLVERGKRETVGALTTVLEIQFIT